MIRTGDQDRWSEQVISKRAHLHPDERVAVRTDHQRALATPLTAGGVLTPPEGAAAWHSWRSAAASSTPTAAEASGALGSGHRINKYH